MIFPTCEVGVCRFDSHKDQLQKCLEGSCDTSVTSLQNQKENRLNCSAGLHFWTFKNWPQLAEISNLVSFFILLTSEGSYREVYQECQPSYDIFCRWSQTLFRPQVPCTPSLHCPIANLHQHRANNQYIGRLIK